MAAAAHTLCHSPFASKISSWTIPGTRCELCITPTHNACSFIRITRPPAAKAPSKAAAACWAHHRESCFRNGMLQLLIFIQSRVWPSALNCICCYCCCRQIMQGLLSLLRKLRKSEGEVSMPAKLHQVLAHTQQLAQPVSWASPNCASLAAACRRAS